MKTYTAKEFIATLQVFIKNQINLDKDLSCAMDELIYKKINNKPSKKRF